MLGRYIAIMANMYSCIFEMRVRTKIAIRSDKSNHDETMAREEPTLDAKDVGRLASLRLAVASKRPVSHSS